jgi:hypothetical protein
VVHAPKFLLRPKPPSIENACVFFFFFSALENACLVQDSGNEIFRVPLYSVSLDITADWK